MQKQLDTMAEGDLPLEVDETFGLSERELTRCRELFDSIDRDKNGVIDVREMRLMLQKSSTKQAKVSKKHARRAMAEADQEGLGFVTFREFKRVVAERRQMSRIHNEQETLDAFVALGGQEDGEG